MPNIQGNLKNAMYILQDYCKYSECSTCKIRKQCFNGFVNNPADFDIAPATIVLGCIDKDVCSEYILMKSKLTSQIISLEKENKSLKAQLEYAIALRTALEEKLDETNPNWRTTKGVACESA